MPVSYIYWGLFHTNTVRVVAFYNSLKTNHEFLFTFILKKEKERLLQKMSDSSCYIANREKERSQWNYISSFTV